MIWTTTPWTLPANTAVAVHPELTYAGIRYVDQASGDTIHTILAADLAPKVMALRGLEFSELGRCRGKDLEGLEYHHPFIDRTSPSCWPRTSASTTEPVWSTPRLDTVPRTTRPAEPTTSRC